jgi:hypothetical protein
MPAFHCAATTAAFTALIVTASSVAASIPAHADQSYLSMSSTMRMVPAASGRTPNGYFNEQVIYVDGLVSMSEAAANDVINHHSNTVQLRYWGDDTNNDDLLFGPVNAFSLFARPDGLHFENAQTLTHQQLDEDSGTLENIGDGGIDEIYVGARFLDSKGNTISKVESNRLEGDF